MLQVDPKINFPKFENMFHRDPNPKFHSSEQVIHTDDGFEFTVDRMTLISQSKYFKSIFEYENNRCILIRGISGSTMKEILNYMHTGKLNLNSRNICNLLEAADYLMLDEILKRVRLALPKQIDQWNCIDIFQASSKLEHLNLLHLCYCFIRTFFDSVVKLSEVGKLSFDDLKRILTDPQLKLHDEGIAWDAVVKWVKGNPEKRYSSIPSLLLCVRLEMCSDECIRNIMENPYVLSNQILNSIVTQIIESGHGDFRKCFIESLKRQESPEPTRFGPRQYVVFAMVDTNKLDVQLFILTSCEKLSRVSMSRNFAPRQVFRCDKKVYMVICLTSELVCFDLLASSWRAIPRPTTATVFGNSIAYVVVSSSMYVIWIEPDSAILNISVYDPQENKWKNRRPLSFGVVHRVRSFSAVFHQGFVYAALATGDDKSLNAIGGVYNPITDVWSQLMPPHLKSTLISMVSSKDILLMIHDQTTSAERFYPEVGVWRPFKDLPYTYNFPHAEIRNDVLVVYEWYYVNERRAIYWDEIGNEWRDGNALFEAPSFFVFDEPEVVRKYQVQPVDNEWETLLREWN